MYWSPNFLAVVFKKQEISQQVVTRMQYLASEFSKIFWGLYSQTLTAGGGDPLPHPTSSPAFDRAWGASAPVLGPKPGLAPLTFQPWLQYAPLAGRRWGNKGRRKRKRGKARKRREREIVHPRSFLWASRPFAHSAPNLRNELLRTQRALMSTQPDPTRPAGIPVPVAYPYDYH